MQEILGALHVLQSCCCYCVGHKGGRTGEEKQRGKRAVLGPARKEGQHRLRVTEPNLRKSIRTEAVSAS